METVKDYQEYAISLIDRRYEVEREIVKLKKEQDELNNAIAAILLEHNLKDLEGSGGVGYSLMTTTKYDFNIGAYKIIEDLNLTEHFVAKPKITKSKLDALVKDEIISRVDAAPIYDTWMTVEQSPYTLRKKVYKEVL